MDIVVCGAQAPFVHGGAEMAMDNLVGALQAAGHRADLVRLPVAWDKDRMFESALAWRLVPLDADMIICTNFPSYFAVHPNKVVWLFHQNRGAYDAIDAPWSDLGYDDISVEAQRQMTEWDGRVLGEARRRFTTSGVVADRLRRFNGLDATPLYHPPPLADMLRTGRTGDYLFCPTRLEANKRPELILRGLAHARSPVRAIVSGRGSLHDDLADEARRSGLDNRFDLAGFVSDEALVDLFADALAVVYVPQDEDYGYVTLQAFLAGKAVITASDSGGVLEWVVDGQTGLVTDGSPEQLGDAYDRLAADPALAARLGAAGREMVSSLSWDHVVRTLIGQAPA